MTPQLGTVQVLWEDWRLEMRVPWRAWTYNGEKAPHRLQALEPGDHPRQARLEVGGGESAGGGKAGAESLMEADHQVRGRR